MLLPLADVIDAGTTPWALTVLVGGLLASVAIAVGPPVRDFVRRTPARARALRASVIETARDPRRAQETVESIGRLPRAAIWYGLIGFALAVWAAYAFTQSTTETRAVERTQFEYVTSMGYVARGAPSVALPSGIASPVSAESVAQSGSQPPLYSAVLTGIDFGFQYEMRSREPLEVLGVAGTALRVRAQDGWERTLVAQPAQPIVGPRVTLWFTVDLDAVRLVIAGVESETGSRSDWYDLTVVPVVRLAGQQGGQHIDDTYSREFKLRYDRVRITPDAELNQTTRKTVTSRLEMPRRAGAFGISMEMAFARWAGAIGAIVALVGAAMLVVAGPPVAADSAPVVAATRDRSPKVERSAKPTVAKSTPPAAQAPAPVAAAPSALQTAAASSDVPGPAALAADLSSLTARITSHADGTVTDAGPLPDHAEQPASAERPAVERVEPTT